MILVALVARADAGSFESETIAQVRHDYFGEPFVPVAEYVRLFERAGSVGVTAYAGGLWERGIDASLDPELFLFQLDETRAWGRWTVGRQQAITALHPQTFDGARIDVSPVAGLGITGWGGVARHHDLDDLQDGSAMGRAEVRYQRGGAALRGGFELDDDLDPSEDLEARMRLGTSGLVPEARGRIVLSGDEANWTQVALSGNVASGARVTVDAERRLAFDPADLLGDALVATYARGSVDAVGLGLRLADRTWSVLSVHYTLDAYEQADGEVYGHAVDASFSKATHAAFRVVPAYRFRAGPGGMFHAVYLSAELAIDDATRLDGTAAWVPYRKLHDPWTSATSLGLEASRELGSAVTCTLGADVARDAVYALDVRGTAMLGVRL